MATIPTPRSFSQVFGDMLDTFLSRFDIPSIKPGSPVDAMLNAAAQSDLRSSQDIFTMLNAQSLDRAQGTALDRIGADEDVPRQTQTSSSGSVNIGDSSFAKISTKIYQGQPAPIVGSGFLYVVDGSKFPASGNVYVGRGTTNYEGPLAFTAIANLGTYWQLTLGSSSKTKKFHNLSESVILAQGGDRVIDGGTIVQTPQGNVSNAIQFSTVYSATIPDGEIQVTGVAVIAKQPGIVGNVQDGTINQFVSAPFSGATVTNPLPFTNALPTWDDPTYREAIKNARQSRSKGTALAIKTGVLGITSPDDNKIVTSANVVSQEGTPTTLYIDDGTGYEEQAQGISLETLMDSALGGEQYFQVAAPRPVTKAFVATVLTAPFTLASGMVLSVKVGGFLSQHTFSGTEFRNIGNAAADEVVSSINADANISFSARTLGSDTQVVIFAKSDTDEDVEVVATASPDVDANPFLGFPAGRVDTMRLYLDDRLLSKDGQPAVVTSNSQSGWASMSGSQTLSVQVDGTPLTTYTFTDTDFINAGTGYATLASNNSLSAWAAVFNAKIPGITVTTAGGELVLTSNLDASARAQILITGGTLVSGGKMFTFNTGIGLLSQGKANDYTLDRNTGQIRLSSVMQAQSRLTVGSLETRAFIESGVLTPTTLASNGELWFVVDGEASIINTGVISSTIINIAEYVPSTPVTWGHRVRVTAASGAPFTNIKKGDWVVLLDTNLASNNRGAWRLAYVDPGSTFFDIERSYVGAQSGVTLSGGSMVFVRTQANIQHIVIPAATNYTAATFVDSINSTLLGATAEVYQTNQIRVRTNSYGSEGDIALVAMNAVGKLLQLPSGSAIANITSHQASVETGNVEAGTPDFTNTTISSTVSSTSFVLGSASNIGRSDLLVFDQDLPDVDTTVSSTTGISRYGTNTAYRTAISSLTGTTVVVRRSSVNEYLPHDRVHAASAFAISAQDDFTVVVDQDTASKRYAMNLYRRTNPVGTTYSTTLTLTDADNSGQTLATGFGLNFNFNDFAVWMKARTKSHAESGDTTKTILWRYNRFGPDGNTAVLRYVYPQAPSQAVTVTVDNVSQPASSRVLVSLPSGAARTGVNVRNSTKVGLMTAAGAGGLQVLTYILGYATAAKRQIQLDYTGRGTTAFSGTVTGGTSGATGVVISDSLSGGLSGAGTLVLSSTTGTFIASEALTGTAGAGTTVAGQYGLTILTPNIGAVGATDHGIAVSSQIWLQSSSGSFTSGLKSITARTATTLSYIDSPTTVATVSIAGDISFDSAEATLAASTVIVGDVVTVGSATGLTGYQQTGAVQSLSSQFWTINAETALSTGTVPTWLSLTNAAALQFYSINAASNQAVQIATAVNALGGTCPVTAVAVGAGSVNTGQISSASYDDFATAGYQYTLSDGENGVQSTTLPGSPSGNYSVVLKNGITADLATNSDFANEEIRLIPRTAQNLADFVNVTAVSGLSTAAEVAVSDQFGSVQISSLTVGSSGAVNVQGGSGNALSSNVIGSALLMNPYAMVSVKASDVSALAANMWVDVQNTVPMPKDVFTGSSTAVSIDTSGNFTLSGTQAWTYANGGAAAVDGFTWQIEQQSRYTCFTWNGIGSAPDLTSIPEGSWVVIATGSGNISSRNTGTFRVVRCDNVANFWIENPNSSFEVVGCNLSFLTYDSILPGDVLNISTTLWGAANVGTWTVKAIGSSVFQFQVDTSAKSTAAFTGPVSLGGQANLVQCVESAATKVVKKVLSVVGDARDVTLANVKFTTSAGYQKIGAVAGSIIIAKDKLAFPTTLATGIDGYSHSTGLIGEAAKVLYGDETDPATYPGIVAAGANVNISGPLVKRIRVALQIRVRSSTISSSGITINDVEDRVRSAVASVINNTAVGTSISLSDIVTAAGTVNGVIAVTVLSPTYGAGNDLISVQPYEKPLVLNLEQDIQVSSVGE